MIKFIKQIFSKKDKKLQLKNEFEDIDVYNTFRVIAFILNQIKEHGSIKDYPIVIKDRETNQRKLIYCVNYLEEIAKNHLNIKHEKKDIVYCELFSKEFYEYQKDGYIINEELSNLAKNTFSNYYCKIVVMEKNIYHTKKSRLNNKKDI